MNKEVFNDQHILFDETAQTQEEAFQVIANLAKKHGYVASQEAYFAGLQAREAEATTGFKDGIAIPHAKDETCLKPGMFMVRFAHPIAWNALDQKPVTVALALTIPTEGASEHLKLLSLIARKFIDDDFRQTILNNDDVAVLSQTIEQIDF